MRAHGCRESLYTICALTGTMEGQVKGTSGAITGVGPTVGTPHTQYSGLLHCSCARTPVTSSE